MNWYRLPRCVAAIAASGLLGLGAAAQASAGYVNNAEQWARMNPAEKAAYAEGINDAANFIYVNDDMPTGIIKVARTRCLMQTKMAPPLLSDTITSAYAKFLQFKDQPPLVVYMARLTDICRPIINEERARFGLPPQ